MDRRSFQFTVGMLAEMTGSNRQYLSRKIKRMMEDPDIQLQAVIRSNKEGYRIPEEEVLRCFDQVTPQQVEEFKAQYTGVPRVRKLTRETEEKAPKYLEKENALLLEWKFRLAASAPEQKRSEEMRHYLEGELQKIREVQEAKLREQILLEAFLENCGRAIEDLEARLENWPEK